MRHVTSKGDAGTSLPAPNNRIFRALPEAMVKRAPVSRANTCAAPKDGAQWQRDVVGGRDAEGVVALRRRPAI